jgi:hypothetical protein
MLAYASLLSATLRSEHFAIVCDGLCGFDVQLPFSTAPRRCSPALLLSLVLACVLLQGYCLAKRVLVSQQRISLCV